MCIISRSLYNGPAPAYLKTSRAPYVVDAIVWTPFSELGECRARRDISPRTKKSLGFFSAIDRCWTLAMCNIRTRSMNQSTSRLVVSKGNYLKSLPSMFFLSYISPSIKIADFEHRVMAQNYGPLTTVFTASSSFYMGASNPGLHDAAMWRAFVAMDTHMPRHLAIQRDGSSQLWTLVTIDVTTSAHFRGAFIALLDGTPFFPSLARSPRGILVYGYSYKRWDKQPGKECRL